MFDSRFLQDLPAIVANAKEGDYLSCHNVFIYGRTMIKNDEVPAQYVSEYINGAFKKLSQSEKERIANALNIDLKDIEKNIIDYIPLLSKPAFSRLVKKVSASRGRPNLNDKEEIKRIKVGAEVEKLHQLYGDRDSVDYEETIASGLQPKERAFKEVSEKVIMSEANVKRAHKLYKEFQEYGVIDENGDFIFN